MFPTNSGFSLKIRKLGGIINFKIFQSWNRATLDLKLFKAAADYQAFLKRFSKYFDPYFITAAYYLIPNHSHFLNKVKSLEEVKSSLGKENTKAAQLVLAEEIPINDFLEDQARRLFSAYVLKHKYKYDRRGNLFSERFKRVKIKSEEKLFYLLCYIHQSGNIEYLSFFFRKCRKE